MQGYKNYKVQNYKACMVLAAVGDAMGYKGGSWQFNTSSKIIHAQMMKMTDNKGVNNLKIDLSWRYSDDTVMHLATAIALSKFKKNEEEQKICQQIGVQYKKCWQRMSGRAPGHTTGKSIQILNADGSNWNKIPFNKSGGGCGGSMRSACIGLVYFNQQQKLIALAIEAGRITHHNPIGYLGSVVSSYFTGLAVLGIQPKLWMAYLCEKGFKIAQAYIKKADRQVKENLFGKDWDRFVQACQQYAQKRNLSLKIDQATDPIFPENYGIIQRQHFYKEISWNGWPGALGIDSVLIAYDAILGCKGNWQQLCLRGILHGGDNDSTGTIAGAWFGTLYGFSTVPKNHYKQVEDGQKLQILGQKLFNMSK